MEQREESRDGSDGWVEDALQNDFMVANMLMRLSGCAGITHQWVGRLPRSRQQQPLSKTEDAQESARASPTTPLSWSGASSTSACDGSSRPAKRKCPDDSAQCDKPSSSSAPVTTDDKSKVGGTKIIARLKIKTKKKKTTSELKEEKNMLLLEKENLIMELETLQPIFKDLMLKNEKLKKLKLDLESCRGSDLPSAQASRLVPPARVLLPDLNNPAPEVELDA